MLVLEESPVQLPTCIGSQFVEAGILDLLRQGKETAAPSPLHLDEFALYHVALLPVELHIEHPAHVRRPASIGLPCVSREPDGVAQLIACVVHVDEDFLLRNGIAESREAFQDGTECLGKMEDFLCRHILEDIRRTVGCCFVFYEGKGFPAFDGGNVRGVGGSPESHTLLLLRALHDVVFVPKRSIVARILHGFEDVIVRIATPGSNETVGSDAKHQHLILHQVVSAFNGQVVHRRKAVGIVVAYLELDGVGLSYEVVIRQIGIAHLALEAEQF